MLSYLYNLIFFAIIVPIVVVVLLIMYKFRDNLHKYLKLGIIIGIFFLTRIMLTFFNVGIFPALVNDILFYALAFVFGMILVFFYAYKIEEVDIKEMYWIHEKKGLSILFGLLAGIGILLISSGFMLLLGSLPINIETNVDGIIVAVLFGAGALYEEIFFRGILQNTLEEDLNDSNKAILIQAIVFCGIHLFYLSFAGFGLFYAIIFIMAIILGYLKKRFGLLSSTLAHALFVFLAAFLT